MTAAAVACVVVLAAQVTWAQPPVARPLPPPKPATEAKPPDTEPAAAVPPPGPVVTTPAPVRPGNAAAVPATAVQSSAPAGDQPPSEASLGVPIMPNAHYLGSYDAGGAGQRFYLFGSQHRFVDVVSYYRTVLRDRGDLVFDSPGTHMFEVGRFREDQVAFPPGVTVKDYALHGFPGLANPRPGGSPETFPTVIQIVPPATVASRPR